MKTRYSSLPALVAGAATLLGASAALATNGMDLEGYGPIALGMGGASLAFDNGTGAMINNPATLGLAKEGSRLEIAFGALGPKVRAEMTMPGAPVFREESSSTIFAMPALGYVRNSEKWSIGLGVFGQGGMGTNYGDSSFMSMNPVTGEPTGLTNMSSVSVGRMLIPATYRLNDKLIIGGTADLVYAGLDMEMLISGAQFTDMMTPGQQTMGTATPDAIFAGILADPSLGEMEYAHLSLNDESDVKSATDAFGFGLNLGFLYQATDKIAIGGIYHSKTWLADLEGRGQMAMSMANTGLMPAMTGDITIKDFEWPQLFGLGFAAQATDQLLISLDAKYIGWKDVMDDFQLHYKADDEFGGGSMDMALYQNWDDQLVIATVLQYTLDETLDLRAGYNYGKNPIPDEYVNPLFPAIVENHATLGAGWKLSDSGRIDLAFSHAFEIDQQNSNPLSGGVVSFHSQNNFQISYLYSF